MSNQPDSLQLAKSAANQAAEHLAATRGTTDEAAQIHAAVGNAWANLSHAHAVIAGMTADQAMEQPPRADVVNTLLEAAGAARTRTLPPPKPGTHESDLLVWRRIMSDEVPGEWRTARAWSTANRQENT